MQRFWLTTGWPLVLQAVVILMSLVLAIGGNEDWG